MDNNTQTPGQSPFGLAFTVVSITTGSFAAITPQIELIVRMVAAGIAIVSGMMAIRYYHFATKEKIQAINKSK